VATHGRGVYIADLAPLAELTPAVLAQEAHFFDPAPEIRWIADDRTNYAFQNFEGESEEPGASLYFYLSSSADATLTVYQGALAIREVEVAGTAGVNVVQWDLQKWVERSADEQARLREQRSERRQQGGGFNRGGPTAEERGRYAISDAAPGTYRVVLSVNGTEHERMIEVLRDEWWNERR